MVGAASGGVLDFSMRAISITEFSTKVEWSVGVGGKIWGLLIFMEKFWPPDREQKIMHHSNRSNIYDDSAAHSRGTASVYLRASIGIYNSGAVG